MNSSVKFFDPIVSVVDALAGLRRISFGAGAADGVALEDSVDSSPPPPHPASNRTSTTGAATRRSMRARLSPARQTAGRGFAQDYLRPFFDRKSSATVEASSLSTSTRLTISTRLSVVSLELTSLRTCDTSDVAAVLAISGTTASVWARCFGSSRVMNPLAGIADCVLNRLAQLTLLALSAETDSGPATSS